MNMRKIIAVMAAVLMLCSIIPMSAIVSADGAFDFESGTVSGWNSGCSIEVVDDNGSKVLKWDASGADWANIYYYGSSMVSANKDYVVSFRVKADRNTNINFKVNNNWAGDTAAKTYNVSTEWQEYSEVINSGACTSGALLLFSSNTTAANGATYYLDDISFVEYVEPVEPGTVINGDFETGDLSGWEKHQSTVISTDAHSGSYAANLKGNGGWGGMLNQNVSVTAGKSYEVSLWYKVNSNGTNVQIKDGGTSGANLASNWVTNTAWTQLVYTVIPTTDIICFNFCGGGNGVAEDVLIDDITVTELKDPSFDGYITNGDFEIGKVAPWTVYSETAVDAAAAKDGDFGLHIKYPSGGWGGTAYQDFTVEVGKTYVVMMDAKAVSNGQNIQIQNNGATKASKWFTATSWTTLSFQFTAESTNSRINICGGGTGGSEEIYVDNVFVFEKKDASNDGYIVNGDFETGTTEGLTPYQSTCVSRDAAKDGNFGLKMMGNGGWGGVGLWTITGLEAGATYKFEMDMNAIEQGFNWTLWQDSTSSGVKYASGYFSTKAWTTIEKEFVANTGTAVLNINGGGNGNAETVYLDNLKITLVKPAHVCEFVGEVTLAPTCTEPGIMTYSCTCGEGTYTEEIPAAHTYDDDCDADCNVCEEWREAPHNLTTYVEAVVPANCQEEGWSEYWICEDCNGTFCSNGAGGYYETNPAWLYYYGDCVRPEGAADCAVVPCEVCGNDTYGYGEHDTGVPACQGGTCSKCGDTIEGYGCQNYDTPACMDGVCYYCGGFVAGYGHENGAWAACCDGECSYGCGLTYPATAEHVDDDGDDYCDTCWNHLNHDVDPCVGGECSICWTYVEGAHTYADDFDVDCDICGEVREITAGVEILVEGGLSIREDEDGVIGLAAKFDISVEGLSIKEGKFTQADYTNATVGGYKLLGMGVVASNGVSSVNIDAKYLCELDEVSASFAARIINIPADKLDVEITFASYFIVEINGVATTIYGGEQANSYNGVLA